MLNRLEALIGLDASRASHLDGTIARELRASRIERVTSTTSTLSACNLFYATLIAVWFWGRGAELEIVAWWTAMLALNGIAFVRHRRRPSGWRSSGSRRAARSVVHQAALLATLFAVAPLFLLPVAHGTDAVIVAVMSACALVIGVYVVHPLPRAALAWLGCSTVLNTVSYVVLSGDGPLMVVGTIGLVTAWGVGRATIRQGQRDVEEFEARLRLREKQDVIALLLKEYEDGSSAWLWECDAMGRMSRVPPALLQLLPEGRDASTLDHLAGLVRVIVPEERDAVAKALFETLGAKVPFHDLLLPITARGNETRWLSVRGKPLHDGKGGFTGFRGLVSDVTETKLAEDRVHFLASHDALTKLPNRITFASTVRPWFQGGVEGGRAFAPLHIDLDRFKLVNDTLGHLAGDELLTLVADRLRVAVEAAHPDATCARVGGDEFMAAIPLGEPGMFAAHATIEDAMAAGAIDDAPARALAQSIVDALGEPFELRAGGVTIGASVGYAVWPHDCPDPATMPARVDVALYRAKEQGRGQVARYTEGMDRRAQDRQRIEVALRGALERGELHLAYQPVVDLEDGRIGGMEALLRWTHPEMGVIGPDCFIPLAEESGAIAPIGAWVLREACQEATTWSRDLNVAVNVSPKQMLRCEFVEEVLDALARTGLPPQRLELELTESILVEDAERALATIDKLRRVGVRVVLDDFGTGYASLSYLRSFVFDKIKIDRSFVSTMGEAPQDGRPTSDTLVEAIVGLAQTLGMRTTAEGIEREWEADELRRMGCDQGQGYLFSRPLPARDACVFTSTAGDNSDQALSA